MSSDQAASCQTAGLRQVTDVEESRVPWYALKVRTRSELMAASALRSRGHGPFCPTYLERRRYSDRMKLVQAVYFPGYIFCQFELSAKLSILTSQAIEYIVGTAGVPSAIPKTEMNSICLAVRAGARPATYPKTGQHVRVEYGALKGIEGVLEKTASHARLVVSVHLLQRSVSLLIAEDQVHFL